MTLYTTLFGGLTAAALTSCATQVTQPSGPLSAEGRPLQHNQEVWLPSQGDSYMLADKVRVDLTRSCPKNDEVVIMPVEGTYLLEAGICVRPSYLFVSPDVTTWLTTNIYPEPYPYHITD